MRATLNSTSGLLLVSPHVKLFHSIPKLQVSGGSRFKRRRAPSPSSELGLLQVADSGLRLLHTCDSGRLHRRLSFLHSQDIEEGIYHSVSQSATVRSQPPSPNLQLYYSFSYS